MTNNDKYKRWTFILDDRAVKALKDIRSIIPELKVGHFVSDAIINYSIMIQKLADQIGELEDKAEEKGDNKA